MSEYPPSASQRSPSAMPDYRVAAFRRAVAARLRAGDASHIDAAATLATLIREQQAMAVALNDPAFEQAMAQALVQEMQVQEPHSDYAMPLDEAKNYVHGILQNRTRDAKAFAEFLKQPSFVSSAIQEAKQPAPVPKEYELPAVKQEEIIRRLVQPYDADGAEPPIHVAASALGHRVVHKALANIFRPKAGELREPLVQALQRAWPEGDAEQIHQLATTWLKARHDPAHSIADGLAPTGTMYLEAQRRANEIMAKKATPNLPTTQVATHGAVLSAAPALLPVRASEKAKTREERAQDIAYTINHAVSCGTTDIFIVPGITAAFSSNFNWKTFWHEAGHYLQGEIIGDFLAVPLTIGVQRFAPNFMSSVSRFIEPIAKPFFHNGAKNAAERWGNKQGLDATNEQVVARTEAIYQHEIKHLPQALVWNMFSFPLGVIGQRYFGHESNSWIIARNKVLGTAISNVLLIGGRALAPDVAEKIDRADSKYIITPVTKTVGKLFGIDEETVDRMAKHSQEDAPWSHRVRSEHAEAATLEAQRA